MTASTEGKASTKTKLDTEIDDVIKDVYLKATEEPLPADLVALVRKLAKKQS